MTTKRIRCSCGRVYDPVKRPECPDCGAPHAVAKPAVDPKKEEQKETPPGPQPSPGPAPLPISPRTMAIGIGTLLLLTIVIALSRCGSNEQRKNIIAPSPAATPTATPAPTATAAPTITAAPTQSPPPAIVTPPPSNVTPPPGGNQFVPGLTTDLNAMIASAEPGATIKVPPGMYPGGLVITKAVRLIGTNGQVYIQSEGRECLSVRAPGVSVQNIQFNCNGIGELPAISVADGAELELEGCKVQSTTAVALTATGNAALKTLGCNFTSANGVALRLTNGARAHLTQSSITDSRMGLWLAQGAAAELHSCAFERNGGEEAKGSILAVNNPKSTLTADDCHFSNNPGGISAVGGAALSITNCSFSNNGSVPRSGGVVGLITLFNHSNGKVQSCLFENNQQGVSVNDGSKLEMVKCQLNGTGVRQIRDVIPSCQPISVFGKESVAEVRETAIFDSVQYGIVSLGGGKLALESVEIAGTRSAGLVVGDRTAGAGEAQIKHCRFRNNGNGIGVFAASSATVEDSEFRENQDGIIVLDKDSRLRGQKLTFVANRDAGLFVHALGEATVTGSDFQNNGRGVVAGVKNKSAERAAATLEDCRFNGNRTFGAGACAGSTMVLTRCTFESTDKQNIYKERNATVQIDAPENPSPSPEPESDASPSPAEEQPGLSPSPSSTARPRPRPTARPRRPQPNDAERILREIFRPH